MLGIDGRQLQTALTLLGLAFGSYFLSARYYSSASFEHPIFLSVFSLLTSSLLLIATARWRARIRPVDIIGAPGRFTSQEPVNIKNPRDVARATIDVFARLSNAFRTLLFCLVARSLLFWFTLRVSQCARPGLEAALPLFVLIFDTAISALSNDTIEAEGQWPNKFVPTVRWRSPSLLYGLLTVAWVGAAIFALGNSRITTGTSCPIGWRIESSTPHLQMLMCILDGLIIAQLSHLRRGEGEDVRDPTKILSLVFVIAAGILAFVSFVPIIREQGLLWKIRLHYVDVRDLALDSWIVSVVLLCGIYLFDALHPTTVTLVVITLGLFGSVIAQLGYSPLPPPITIRDLVQANTLAAVLGAAMLFFALHPRGPSRSSMTAYLHRWVFLGYLGLLAAVVVFAILYGPVPIRASLPHAVQRIVQSATLSADEWAQSASASKSLDEAVAEYRRRYNISPPPNFDKWYEFAIERNSAVIDSFDQINDDLHPFWGMEPSLIRSHTKELLEYPALGLGGVRIRNGSFEQSPHIPGTHHWMTDSIQKMVEPFAKWLPDMDIAINLADECHAVVPYSERTLVLSKAANETKARVSKADHPSNSWTGNTEWEENFPDPLHGIQALPPNWEATGRQQLYYKWLAPTCPPDSEALRSRWWDRSTACLDCVKPHSVMTRSGPVAIHHLHPGEVCYQPDLAYLNGFIASQPMPMTTHMLPLFSQARVDGFSDILFPSPWNYINKTEYREDTDLTWEDKTNGMFWRGSPSDGYAQDGIWTGFLRARAVHEGYEESKWRSHHPGGSGLIVNMSFTGEVHKCDGYDCDVERDSFKLWSTAARSGNDGEDEDGKTILHNLPFEEHWRYRHLIDMDGAGFSGRFLPFLESNSIIYRAALFRAWFDERLQEWHHYVPADARLGQGFWAVVDFLSSKKAVSDESGAKQTGDDMAKKIAEQGRDWTKKVLRPEDMEIYMFRLLLEWGRVVDDDRESLGYMGTG